MFSNLNRNEAARLDGVLCGSLEQINGSQPGDGNWDESAKAMWDETAEVIYDLRGDVGQCNPALLGYRLDGR